MACLLHRAVIITRQLVMMVSAVNILYMQFLIY